MVPMGLLAGVMPAVGGDAAARSPTRCGELKR